MRTIATAALAIALLLGGGASATEVGAGYAPTDKDERGLWMQMDEAERQLRTSDFVMRDPALNAYVRDVLCRMVGQAECGAVRLYLVRTPIFNASMAPNGVMIVNSGLFLRVRDEAQLAAVLGHEFTHYRKQHSLRLFREARGKASTVAWLSVIPVVNIGAGLAVASLQYGMLGSLFAFSRDMEREADSGSIQLLADAGYDPLAASRIWQQIDAERTATATARGRKKKAEGGFFATHPTSIERIAALQAQAAAMPAASAGQSNRDAYRAALGPYWPALIDDQIKLNDFGGTELLLAALAADRWTDELNFARGELYRSRGTPDDLGKAAGFYREAIAGGTIAEAWRGLGLALLRSGDRAEGQAALKEYLARRPDAGDRAMIAMLAGGEK